MMPRIPIMDVEPVIGCGRCAAKAVIARDFETCQASLRLPPLSAMWLRAGRG